MKNVTRLFLMSVLAVFSANASAFVKNEHGNGFDKKPHYTVSLKPEKRMFRSHEKTFEIKKCWVGCGKKHEANVDISFIPETYTGHDLRHVIKNLKTMVISMKTNHEQHYPGCGHDDKIPTNGEPSGKVPEPGILGLMAIGLLGMVAVRRKKS